MGWMTRRAFLKVAGATGAGVIAGCTVPPSDGDPTVIASPAAPDAAPMFPPAPAEILITPSGELYTQSYSFVPSLYEDRFRLRIHGLVDQERILTLAELRGMPRVESLRTLECIGNPVGGSLIGNVVWAGVEAAALWQEVGVRPEARRAKFEAEDDYTTSVELKWITQPGVLLVYEMNGEPLLPEHGWPLRILMPGLYGQKMPKWIRDIEFIDYDHRGYWEQRGWSEVASVQTNSIIRQPRGLEQTGEGVVPVWGVAFAGLRRITRVEVRVDDGEWQSANLLQDDSSLVWTQWSYDWPADGGRHKVAVRAGDESGFVQSTEADSVLASSFPAGTDRIHSVVVTVG